MPYGMCTRTITLKTTLHHKIDVHKDKVSPQEYETAEMKLISFIGFTTCKSLPADYWMTK